MAGRPLKIKSLRDMQKKISAYFRKCDKRTKQIVTRDGLIVDVDDPAPYTVCGLALALGFSSRQSLLDYAQKDQYMDTLRKCKLKIEQNVVQRSLENKNNANISQLILKNNFKWQDKTEVEHSGELSLLDYISNIEKEEKDA